MSPPAEPPGAPPPFPPLSPTIPRWDELAPPTRARLLIDLTALLIGHLRRDDPAATEVHDERP